MSISPNPVATSPEPGTAPEGERRSNGRHPAIYRPCCVIASGRVLMGLIRNYSDGGAKIEADANFQVGDRIQYFWDVQTCIAARIVWTNGHEHGLEHEGAIPARGDMFPLRSVRIPCKAEATCWVGGEAHVGQVENIAIGGIRIRGLPAFQQGTMMTVKFCGLEMESAAVRWTDRERTGVRFNQRLSREVLAQLLLNEQFGLTNIEFEHGE
jgi:hypothetical protein